MKKLLLVLVAVSALGLAACSSCPCKKDPASAECAKAMENKKCACDSTKCPCAKDAKSEECKKIREGKKECPCAEKDCCCKKAAKAKAAAK